jgi:hypothetical protein
LWGKLECGVIYVGSGLADNLEEFGHEAEAVSGGAKNGVDIDEQTNLALS